MTFIHPRLVPRMFLLFSEFLFSDGSTSFAVTKKRVLMAFAIGVVVIPGFAVGWSSGLQLYFYIPAMLGGCAVLLGMLANQPSHVAAELLMYLSFLSLLLNDWHGAKYLGYRTWPAVIIILNVAIICELARRVLYVLLSTLSVWFVVVATEEAYRWGLFDITSNTHFKESTYDCAHPPCARGPSVAAASLVISFAVLATSYCFSRFHVRRLHSETEQLNASIAALNVLAASLTQGYDLTLAETALSTPNLPDPLYDSLDIILLQLEMYRPYLPDVLFADMHRNSSNLRDISVPGAETRRAALVFTDIQGSTATWGACAEAMRKALKVHDAVIRECIAAHNGYEVKTIGDSFMIAFNNALDAVRLGLAVQEMLVNAAWPTELLELEHCRYAPGPWCGLRVRVGVHCGEVDVQVNPLTGRYDYFGNTVNKAARMEGACVGGAVAVTQEVLDEAGDLGDVCMIDMGELDLKGVHVLSSSLLLPSTLVGRKAYVKEQMHLKREERRLIRPEGTKSRVSEMSVLHVPDERRRHKSSGTWSLLSVTTENLRNLQKTVATVGVIEVVLDGFDDSEVIADDMNSVLAKVVTSSERAHGTVVSLQGSRVAVSWNATKACVTHVENSLVFVRLVGAGWGKLSRSDMHMGLATSSTLCGPVGSRRQRFVSVLGVSMDVATTLCTDSKHAEALCFYASETVPSCLFGFGLTTIQKGVFTADDKVMHLFELKSNLTTV